MIVFDHAVPKLKRGEQNISFVTHKGHRADYPPYFILSLEKCFKPGGGTSGGNLIPMTKSKATVNWLKRI